MIYFFTSGIYKVFIYTPLTKSISPNMENVIIIKDKEAFLFGSNPVKLTFKKTGINGILNFKNYKTEIYNDGATLSLYNTINRLEPKNETWRQKTSSVKYT